MADYEVVATLTEQQRKLLAPALRRVAEAHMVMERAKSDLRERLALIEPGMVEPDSGLSYDADTGEIRRAR